MQKSLECLAYLKFGMYLSWPSGRGPRRRAPARQGPIWGVSTAACTLDFKCPLDELEPTTLLFRKSYVAFLAKSVADL